MVPRESILSGPIPHQLDKILTKAARPGGHEGRKENIMTNQEAYLSDLDELREEIDRLLSLVPVGKSKRELQIREQAEEAAGRARATINCMKNDYIIVEL